MLTIDTINNLLGVSESFHASYALDDILRDKEKREALFETFLNHTQDLSFDWFTAYFQAEHSDRKNKKQDFTPDGVVQIASSLLGASDSSVDLCAGTGGLTIKRYAMNPDALFYCEEFSDRAMPFLLFNLAIRNVNGYVCHGDTLTRQFKHVYRLVRGEKFSTITLEDKAPCVKAQTVIMNPPYSMKWEPEADWIEQRRFKGFGALAPKSKSDYAFLLTGFDLLEDGGTMAIILPHGVLFRGAAEAKIRQALVEQNALHAVIGLPEKVFLSTDIPTVVLVLKKGREEEDVLFVDASKGFVKVRASDIKRIVDAFVDRRDIERFARVVSRDEIRDNDYNLNIPRYLDTAEPSESYDIYASMFGGIPVAEIDVLSAYWHAFPGLREMLFESTAPHNAQLRVGPDAIPTAIRGHGAVQGFFAQFDRAFVGFRKALRERIIDRIDTLPIAQSITEIGDDVFSRIADIPLIDKYEAYQILHDAWQPIASDCEILQGEGVEAARKVDANMVIKKVSGKDTLVQEGYVGRILPFELVQKQMLTEESAALEAKEMRLDDIAAELEALVDDLSEDEKDTEALNDDNTAFRSPSVNAMLKVLEKTAESEEDLQFLDKLQQAKALFDEERALKREIKTEALALHQQTKETIEALSHEQTVELLQIKWFDSLIEKLGALPQGRVESLSAKIIALYEKYETTLVELDQQLREANRELADMLGDLVGDEADMKGLAQLRAILGGV